MDAKACPAILNHIVVHPVTVVQLVKILHRQTDRQTHFIDHRTCAQSVVTTGVVDMRRNTSQSYNFHMDPLKTG